MCAIRVSHFSSRRECGRENWRDSKCRISQLVKELSSSFPTYEKAFFRQASFFLVLELCSSEPHIPRLSAAL